MRIVRFLAGPFFVLAGVLHFTHTKFYVAIGANERGAHAFNWQTAGLAAGSHTARIQWRTDLGGTLCVDARSMIIFFHN